MGPGWKAGLISQQQKPGYFAFTLYVPDTALNNLGALSHLTLRTTVWDNHEFPYFTDGQFEAQRGTVDLPQSSNLEIHLLRVSLVRLERERVD